MSSRHWIADAAIGTAAFLAMPLVCGLLFAPLSLLLQVIPDSVGASAGVVVSLLIYGLSVYATVRLWTFLVEWSEVGWRRATPPKRWATVAVATFAIVSLASWTVILERRLALEQSLSAEAPANMPLQPTRAAEPNGKRRAAARAAERQAVRQTRARSVEWRGAVRMGSGEGGCQSAETPCQLPRSIDGPARPPLDDLSRPGQRG